MNIQEQIKQQNKEFEEKWEHGDIPDSFVTYKNDGSGHSIIDRKKVMSWHRNSIKSILEGLVEELNNHPDKIAQVMPDGKLPFVIFGGKADENEKWTIYRQAYKDTISHLQSLIKSIED